MEKNILGVSPFTIVHARQAEKIDGDTSQREIRVALEIESL